ncbi:MAG: ATP-dependent 6-phosphofructokinase [Anaerolineae bacterium]|nr:ATP-dependent 6-phosphofructokinase [Anaerolineae bacterium]
MSAQNITKSIAVLTSGGDAPGMNAAVRAVVRTALDKGVEVYAIYEGYQGMVDGGDRIRKMDWDSVGGILQRGGTVIGSARCAAFRTREGRLRAAHNLIKLGIDNLVVIGGDGSLTGANLFRQEWPDLLAELVNKKSISKKTAELHADLRIVGLVGSIDNDMFGTDMTIGADTALHRITEAIDAISSTAASHQRTFVVEVMGRNCGYLALMSCIATGADWVLIPESPPNVDDWESKMCEVLKAGRTAGRRDSIVIVAEGAADRHGNPISCDYVKKVLEERLGEDTRVTILGHVQRGGSPSAYDRYMSTLLGEDAVETLLDAKADDEPQLIGMRQNRVTRTPLMDCVQKTHSIADLIAAKEFDQAMDMRGSSFKEMFRTLRTLVRALPHPPTPGQRRLRLGVLNCSALSPGMNTATRAAVRIGVDKGHIILGVRNGFQGLVDGDIEEMGWMDVAGWATRGGSELGTNRHMPQGSDFYAIARHIEEHQIEGLLMIGGWVGYQAAYQLFLQRRNFPAFNIPIICLPASINNNLPGSDFSVGADTALNNIVEAVDKIKQSAVASRRCFVVEVMGRYCGYLALMSGLATGAERVYLHEEGITLNALKNDVDYLVKGFQEGKRLGVMIRCENANKFYTTDFIRALFDEEGGDLFDVRQAILGHLQQGGDPSPFDRIQATRLAVKCIDFLVDQADFPDPGASFIGLQGGQVKLHDLQDLPRMVDAEFQRPKKQWWLDLRAIANIMAQPGPKPRL